MTLPFFLSAAAPERGPEPLRGPCGGASGEERVPRMGDGVWRELGHCGGHGGLPAAGPGVCQQRLPGEKPPPQPLPSSVTLTLAVRTCFPCTFPSCPGGGQQSALSCGERDQEPHPGLGSGSCSALDLFSPLQNTGLDSGFQGLLCLEH